MNLQLFAEESGKNSPPEALPPVEVTPNPTVAVEAAAEALTQVKAQEVQALADVLNQLNSSVAEVKSLTSTLTSAIQTVENQKAELAETLAAIQAEREAEKQAAKASPTPVHKSQTRSGLANLLRQP